MVAIGSSRVSMACGFDASDEVSRVPVLLDALRGSRNFESIAGLSYKDVSGQHCHTPERVMKGPDSFPWMPFHRVPVQKYLRPSFFGKRTLGA